VQTTILDADQRPIAGPESLTTGKALSFSFGDHRYALTLTDLRNALIVRTSRRSSSPTHPQRSARTRRSIACLPRRAAARRRLHSQRFRVLRQRRRESHASQAECAGEQIHSAEDFIALCGTKSSESGQPYRIKFADGREVTPRRSSRTRYAS
jgi:hypothetical protein